MYDRGLYCFMLITQHICLLYGPMICFNFKVTECVQTGELESIHALYTKYVPKRKSFSHKGMQARLQVAAMDHNYSAEREQACTRAGVARYKQSYSKAAGGYVVKAIKIQKDYSFRQKLLTGIIDRCSKGICHFYFICSNI